MVVTYGWRRWWLGGRGLVYFIMFTPIFAASLWSDIVTMYSIYFRNIFPYQEAILNLCTEAFLYVRYRFPLISNKFCNLGLLRWPLLRAWYRDVGEGCSAEGQGWKLATIPLYNPLKSPVGAHIHITTYGPLIDTALNVMLLMRANSLLGQVGGGRALGPQMTFAITVWCYFHRTQKTLDFHLPS